MTVTGKVQFVSLEKRICLVVDLESLNTTNIYFPEHCKLPVFGNEISFVVQEYSKPPIFRVAIVFNS